MAHRDQSTFDTEGPEGLMKGRKGTFFLVPILRFLQCLLVIPSLLLPDSQPAKRVAIGCVNGSFLQFLAAHRTSGGQSSAMHGLEKEASQ